MTASRVSRYAWFLASSAAVLAVTWGIGYMPTRRLTGQAGIAAMLAGGAVSFIAAALAGVLLVVAGAETPEARMQRGSLAMIVRLGVVAALGAAAVLSGAFPREPLLFWIGAAYLALLPLEVRLAIL